MTLRADAKDGCADEPAVVAARRERDLDHHRRRSRLAVGAGEPDHSFHLGEFTERLGRAV